MSDISPTTADAPAVVDTPAPADTPAAAPAADLFDDAKVQSFDRAYVEKLRNEAAERRTKHAPFEEAFGAYSPEDQAVFLDLAKTFAADPSAGVDRFEHLATELRKQYPGQKTPTATELAAEAGAEGTDKPMTRSDVEAYLKEQRDADAQEAAVKSITAEVAAVYPVGTADHREVLWLAANETNGDIKAAIAKQAEREQAVVAKFLTGKKEQAGGARPVTTQGSPAGDGQAPKDWKSAKASLLARMAATQA